MWDLDYKESWSFELLCWRRLLRVPWTARRSTQSILKKISPEYSFKELMLKLKFQCFGHLMQRTDSLEKNPDSGKAWRQEEKGMTVDEMVGRHHRLSGHKFEQVLGPGDREARRAAVYGVAKSRTQLSSWTECIHEYTNVYDKSLIHCNLQLQSCVLVYDLEESGIERERERENEFQLKCMLGKPLKTCTWKSRQSPNLQINTWELPFYICKIFHDFWNENGSFYSLFLQCISH